MSEFVYLFGGIDKNCLSVRELSERDKTDKQDEA